MKPETIKDEYNEHIRYNELSGTQGENINVSGNKGLISKLAQFKNPSVYKPLRLLIIFFYIFLYN